MKLFNSKSQLSLLQRQFGSVLRNVLFLCFFFSSFMSLSAQSNSSLNDDNQTLGAKQSVECLMTLTQDELQKIIARDAKRAKAGIGTAKSMVRNVPVKIHIVRRSNGTGGLALANALADIAQANNLYSAVNFNFYQCGTVNYINSNTYFNGITYSTSASSTEHQMANAHKVSDALNVFYCPNTSPSTSWSSFPSYLGTNGKDWIIMKNTHSNNSSTFSHEVGHWFDLYHTHQGSENVTRNSSSSCYNCPTAGDLLCDTPADRGTSFTSSCGYSGTATNSCDGLAYAPIPTNIMSYASKPCRTNFTAGQINRMQLSYDNDRTAIHNASCSNICLPPTTTQNYTNYITSTSARLNSSAAGTHRDFRYRASTTSTWTQVTHTTASFKNISGLSPGTTYYWSSAVRCSNNGLWSAWSANDVFTTPAVCNAPTTAQNYTNNITSTTARLNSSAVGTHRDFRYRASTTSTWTHVSHTTAGYKFISGLTAGTTYYWSSAVRCNNGQWSTWSANDVFTTPLCSPPTIYQNYTTNINSTYARLNCSAAGTHRDFRYRASTTSTWTHVTHSTSSYRYVFGLSPNTTYYWSSGVRCNNGQWSAWSPTESFRTPSSFSSDQTSAKELDQVKEAQLSTGDEAPGDSPIAVARNKRTEVIGQSSVSIAPNPQKVGLESMLIVESIVKGESVLVISDITGKTLVKKEIVLEEGTNQIKLNRFEESGVYLITIQTGSELLTSKLIIAE